MGRKSHLYLTKITTMTMTKTSKSMSLTLRRMRKKTSKRKTLKRTELVTQTKQKNGKCLTLPTPAHSNL